MKVTSLVIRIVSVWGRNDSVPCLSADGRVLLNNKHNTMCNSKWAFFGLCQYCVQWAIWMAR